jgi:hypothetical protein
LQAPIAFFKQFDVPFAEVCLLVARPKVTQNFRATRRFEVRAVKAPEDIEASVLVRHVIQDRVQTVLQCVRSQKLLACRSLKEQS